MIWVILVVSLVGAIIIVNGAYQLFMKILGASGMFFDPTKKIFVTILIAVAIFSFISNLFGIEIPK